MAFENGNNPDTAGAEVDDNARVNHMGVAGE
jgi:hypothetical protein